MTVDPALRLEHRTVQTRTGCGWCGRTMEPYAPAVHDPPAPVPFCSSRCAIARRSYLRRYPTEEGTKP